MKHNFTFSLVLFFLLSCTHKGVQSRTPATHELPLSLNIASYNVENLFDTIHDEGKDDFEYLPLSDQIKIDYCNTLNDSKKLTCMSKDWTEEKLEIKLSQIKKVFEKLSPVPDILGLVEVENENVVRKLADKIGFKSVLMTNSADSRGIDIGLIFNESENLKYIQHTSYSVDTTHVGGKPSRDILVAEFRVGPKNEILVLIMNHWPSQSNPTIARELFAKKVFEIAKIHQKNKKHVLLMGDFNTELQADVPSPFNQLIDAGNIFTLIDVDHLFRKEAAKGLYDASELLQGTYFYPETGKKTSAPVMNWNLLDRFFVSQSLLKNNGIRLDIGTYKIVKDSDIATTYKYQSGLLSGSIVTNVPKAYNFKTSNINDVGFSDHFPVQVSLKLE